MSKTNYIEKADRASVMVSWVGRSELGSLECEVIERGREGTADKVQWCGGESVRVVYCHSLRSYVFARNTCPTCGKGESDPYRRHVNGGAIEYGCVDNFHTGHIVTPSASADWHNRKSAKRIAPEGNMAVIGEDSEMFTNPLDLLVENIMDVALANGRDDARIIIRDLIYKDAESAIRNTPTLIADWQRTP